MKRPSLILLILLTTLRLTAQESRVLGIKEAVSLGMQNNQNLKISASKVRIAEAKYNEAVDQTIPSVKLNANYTRQSPVDEFKVKFPGNDEEQVLYPSIENNYYARLSLSEIVFSGGRLHYAKESQQLLRKAASVDAAKDSQELALTIIQSLFNIYKLRQSQALLKNNLDEVNQHLSESGESEKNGLVTHNEVLKWELQVSGVELSQIDLKDQLEIAVFNLNLMLGLDENTPTDVDSSIVSVITTVDAYDAFEKSALNKRADVEALNLRMQSVSDNLEIIRRSYWPVISVGANYLYARPNQRIFPLKDEWNSTWDVGVNLSFDLTNLYSNQHNIAEYSANYDQYKAQQGLLSDAVRNEVHQAYLNYSLMKEKITVLGKATGQADENYRITNNKYKNQLALQSELFDADYALLKSRIDLVNAKADAAAAWYKLMKVSGQLNSTY